MFKNFAKKKAVLFVAGLALTVGLALTSTGSVDAGVNEGEAGKILSILQAEPNRGIEILEGIAAKILSGKPEHDNDRETIVYIINKAIVGGEYSKDPVFLGKIRKILKQMTPHQPALQQDQQRRQEEQRAQALVRAVERVHQEEQRAQRAQVIARAVGRAHQEERIGQLDQRARANGYKDIIDRARSLPVIPGEKFEKFVLRIFQGTDFGMRFPGSPVLPIGEQKGYDFYFRKDIYEDNSNGGLKLHTASDLRHCGPIKVVCKELALKYNYQCKFFTEPLVDYFMQDRDGCLQSGKFSTIYIPNHDIKAMAFFALELEMKLREKGLTLNSMVAAGLPSVKSDAQLRKIISRGDGIALPGEDTTGLLSFRHEGLERGYRRDTKLIVGVKDPKHHGMEGKFHRQEVDFEQFYGQLLQDLKIIHSQR